jgi:uncharacterized protein YegL
VTEPVLERKRPGAEIATSDLHVVWLCDCSGSMRGEKIESLNFAIREALPAMRDEARTYPHARVLVHAIAFSDGARFVRDDAQPIESFAWTDVTAGGFTDMGAALTLVAERLGSQPSAGGALAPVLILISDGRPTDDFAAGLAALHAQPAFASAQRIAIAVGDDADEECLQLFIGDGGGSPLAAATCADLVERVAWASTIPLRAASTPPVDPAGGLGVPGAAPANVSEEPLECW